MITVLWRSDSYTDADADSDSGSDGDADSDGGRVKQSKASIQIQSIMPHSLFNAIPFQTTFNCS